MFKLGSSVVLIKLIGELMIGMELELRRQLELGVKLPKKKKEMYC